MAGTYKPKKKVICPKCRWKGERAVIGKACPKCSFWHPKPPMTTVEWEAEIRRDNPEATDKAVVSSTVWAILYGLVVPPTP